MAAPFHVLNWFFGWSMLLSAFLTGAVIGCFYRRANFLGGYDSLARRHLRLGHIALAALGMVNLLYALSPWPGEDSWYALPASYAWIVGGLAMPSVCFLAAWKPGFGALFFIPVSSLTLAAIWTLRGALP